MAVILSSCFTKQRTHVERACVHVEVTLGGARPPRLESVPAKLDAVAVGITQIERLAHAVIARTFQRNPSRKQSFQSVGECRPRRIQNSYVIKAGAAGRRGRTAAALPGVEADMVVVSASRYEGRLMAVALGQRESKHAAIECERAVEIRDLEVDVPDLDTGINGMWRQRLFQGRKRGNLVRHSDLPGS